MGDEVDVTVDVRRLHFFDPGHRDRHRRLSVLRLGLLSTANINRGILAAAAAVTTSRSSRWRAATSRRAEAYARERGLARAHGSYEGLLADPEVDAVYVSLPNGLHHEWTMRALEAGKHVLCEKPYSRHPAEVEEAFALAERSGLVLMEAFMYRHHPQTAVVAGLVRDGAIGRPRLVQAAFGFVLESLDDVRADAALDGGALMDLGCYCVSTIRLLGGEPESVAGEQVVGTTGVDMSFEGERSVFRAAPSGAPVLVHGPAAPGAPRSSGRMDGCGSRRRGGSTGAATCSSSGTAR